MEDVVKKVEQMRDFKFQKNKVEEMILNYSHRVMFLPKFYCELNPIEHLWCHAKHYTHSHCDYSFPNLKKIIDTALDSMIVDLIRKYFREVRE